MDACKECGKEVKGNSFYLASGMCDDCYIKVRFYTPDFEYPMKKRFTSKQFSPIDTSKVKNSVDVILAVLDMEQELYNEIKNEARLEDKLLVSVFKEYDIKKIHRSFLSGESVTLEMSYFFTNKKFETVANYEDRNKQHQILISID